MIKSFSTSIAVFIRGIVCWCILVIVFFYINQQMELLPFNINFATDNDIKIYCKFNNLLECNIRKQSAIILAIPIHCNHQTLFYIQRTFYTHFVLTTMVPKLILFRITNLDGWDCIFSVEIITNVIRNFKMLFQQKYNTHINIYYWIEHKKINQATNRNFLVDKINKLFNATVIIAFFDIDDIPHPQRLEFIHTLFQISTLNNISFDSMIHIPIRRHPLNHSFLKCRAWSGFANVTQNGMFDIQFNFDEQNDYNISDDEFNQNIKDLYYKMIQPVFQNDLHDKLVQITYNIDEYFKNYSEFNLYDNAQRPITNYANLFAWFVKTHDIKPAFGWQVFTSNACFNSICEYNVKKDRGEDIKFVEALHKYSHFKVINETLAIYCDGPDSIHGKEVYKFYNNVS
eukprot:334011_1